MKMLKKISLVILIFTLFIAFLIFFSCGKEDKSRIYIVSEEDFKNTVELNKNGEIEKISLKELEKADVRDFVTDVKYYTVVYLDSKTLIRGSLTFGGDVTLYESEIYTGTKSGRETIEAELTGDSNKNKKFEFSAYDYAETDCYVAAAFTVNDFEKEKYSDYGNFNIGLIYSSTYTKNYGRDVSLTKKIQYKKQITAASSIKYVSYEDYMSGNFDDKLKDSIVAPVGQKYFAVIDYTLTAFKDHEETDTASVSISAASENGAKFKLWVEEFPTGEYSSSDTSVTAAFRLRDGGEAGKTYRFIVSITPESEGDVKLSAEILGNKITFLNEKTVEVTTKVIGNVSE